MCDCADARRGKLLGRRALFLNATLKRSPEASSTGALNDYVAQQLASQGVEVGHVRLADHDREWTHTTGDAMAHVLVHTAKALAAAPIPKPPNA